MASPDIQTASNNEPELPPLPPIASITVPQLSRKRTIDDVSGNTSSDLFMFSSDDAPSALENYSYQRPKRQYQGTWWSSQTPATTSSVKQRALTRNFDSGVWMGSDSSFGEDELLNLLESDYFVKDNTKVLKVSKIEDDMIRSFDYRAIGLSDAQWETLKRVDYAVLNNKKAIDLSGLDLESLPWSVMKPLETFTPEPILPFESLEPKLEIYLAQNRLSCLPEEIFNLKGISVLTLRNNKLTELSPAISQLIPSLTELNLSVNKLNYLPMEIREALRCAPKLLILRLTDNPFYQPVENMKGGMNNEVAKPKARYSVLPMLIPPSPPRYSRIAYMNTSGQSINGPAPSKDQKASPMTKFELNQLPQTTSKVPSLYEIAIRKSAEHYITTVLQSLGENVPATMISNLKNAAEQAKTGFQSCSICKRKFSIARTEWIKWQGRLQTYDSVPLLYRGCSWSCLPDIEKLGPEAKNCGWSTSKGLRESDMFG